jgi:hypothetical protein
MNIPWMKIYTIPTSSAVPTEGIPAFTSDTSKREREKGRAQKWPMVKCKK